MFWILGAISLVFGVLLLSHRSSGALQAIPQNDAGHTLITRRVPEIIIGLSMFNLFLMLLASYHGSKLTELVSFVVNDGWCDISREGVGQHCFGDFGLPLIRGGQEFEYDGTGSNFGASNPPLIALLFRILRFFSYNNGLTFYLGGLALAIYFSWYLIWRNHFFSLMFSLVSAGSLAAIDRGNHVPLVAGGLSLYLLFFHGDNEERLKRWSGPSKLAGCLLLALVCSLKYWTPMFLVLPLFSKKYRFFSASLLLFISVNFLALAFLGTGLSNFLNSSTKMALDSGYASAVSRYSISVQTLLGRITCSVSSSCDPSLNHDYRLGIGWTILLLAIPLIFIVYSSLQTRKSVAADFRPFALILASLILLPEAATYNLVLIPSLVLSLPGMAHGIDGVKSLGSSFADTCRTILVRSCLLSTVPFAIWWVPEMAPPGSNTLGSIFGYFRSPSLVTPLVFISAIILIVLLHYRDRRLEKPSLSA